MKRVTILVLLFMVLNVLSATISTNLSLDAIRGAFSVAVEGDTISVAAGELTVTESIYLTNKSVTLQGSGENTCIIRSGPRSTTALFRAANTGGRLWRLTGFTIDCGTNDTEGTVALGALYATNSYFRIDHCTFTNVYKRAIFSSGKLYGVVDSCKFYLVSNVIGIAWSGNGNGTNSWLYEGTNVFGTTNMVVLENNDFYSTSAFGFITEAYMGASYVVRYSRMFGPLTLGHHGYDSSAESPRNFEYYHNTWTNGYVVQSRLGVIRGGTGLMWSNVVLGTGYQTMLQLANYRSCLASHPATGNGPCNGTNAVDGNLLANGWPCHSQVGMTFGGVGTVQTSLPFHYWGNTLNGTNIDGAYPQTDSCSEPAAPGDGPGVLVHIVAGRDYTNAVYAYLPLAYPHPLVTATTPAVYYAPFRKP